MIGLLTFILVFGIYRGCTRVYFTLLKSLGFWFVSLPSGWAPRSFAHIGKDGTAYTIRLLPLGGYVRMAGWGEDTTEIKTGTPVSLTLAEDGKVKRINSLLGRRSTKQLFRCR